MTDENEKSATTTPEKEVELAEKGEGQFQGKHVEEVKQTDPRFTYNVETGYVFMRDSKTGLQTSRKFTGEFSQSDYDAMKDELEDMEEKALKSDHPAGATLPGAQTQQSRDLVDDRNAQAELWPSSLAATDPNARKDEGPDPSVNPQEKKVKDHPAPFIQPGDDVGQRK